MSAAQPAPADPAPDQDASDDAYYRQALHQFIDIALDLAKSLPADTALPADKRAETLERVGRALRRSIILARHIAEHPRHASVQRTLARKRIIRAVDESIVKSANQTEADALRQELCERLDAPDLDDDITHRPIAEIIQEIRRDLGLANIPGTHPWPRRTPENIAALAALAAALPGEAAEPPKPPPAPGRPASPPPCADPGSRDESLLANLLRRDPIRDG